MSINFNRREFGLLSSASAVGIGLPWSVSVAEKQDFAFRYILASCMYGYTDIRKIIPEVKKVHATAIDIWPKVHGNQREQLDEMGEDNFAKLLSEHEIHLGCITQYRLGPFGLQNEMRLARRLGCSTIVSGGKGPPNLKGSELKKAVGGFIEKLKPHLAVAEEMGVTVAIENHESSLIESPDSMKWLVELRPSNHLAVALAPYHLPQDEKLISELIRSLEGGIAMFYAWQHGMGCHKKLPKEQELLQMPGRGKLDFTPILSALRDIKYDGWTEIFMHPVPRGIPVLETTDAITVEINRSRQYLSDRVEAI